MKAKLYEDAISLNESELCHGRHVVGVTSYLKAQYLLSDGGTALRLLKRAFKGLPNLQHITIILRSRWIGAKEIRESLGFPSGSEYNFDGSSTMNTLVRAVGASPLLLRTFRIMTPESTTLACPSRVEEPSNAGRPYEALEVKSIHIEGVTTELPSTMIYSASFQCLNKSLKQLEHLEVMCKRAGPIHHPWPLLHLWAPIASIIRGCSLTLSKLKVDGLQDLSDPNPPIAASLCRLKFPSLKEFDLQDVKFASTHTLATFFNSHASHLVYVSLRDLSICKLFHWTDAMNKLEVRNSKSLISFELHDCGNVYEGDLAPWLTGKTKDISECYDLMLDESGSD